MHQQEYHSRILLFAHTLFLCVFLFISEQTAIISLYFINWLAFITEIYPFKTQWLLYVLYHQV